MLSSAWRFLPDFGSCSEHDFVYVALAYDSGTSGAAGDRRSKIVQYQWDAEARTPKRFSRAPLRPSSGVERYERRRSRTGSCGNRHVGWVELSEDKMSKSLLFAAAFAAFMAGAALPSYADNLPVGIQSPSMAEIFHIPEMTTTTTKRMTRSVAGKAVKLSGGPVIAVCSLSVAPVTSTLQGIPPGPRLDCPR